MDKRQNTLGYHVCMYVHVSLMHWLICTNGIQVQSANRAWTGLILALVLQKGHMQVYTSFGTTMPQSWKGVVMSFSTERTARSRSLMANCKGGW